MLSDALGVALALVEVAAGRDGVALVELDLAGAELVGAGVAEALGSLLGLTVGFGGRLDCGGRTRVTSLTTGSGLFGIAEAPSR